MKKTIVISCSRIDWYLFFLPLAVMSWRRLGYEVLIFMPNYFNLSKEEHEKLAYVQDQTVALGGKFVFFNLIPGYKEKTQCQVIRLLGHYHAEGMIMTGDVDMMCGLDYWYAKALEAVPKEEEWPTKIFAFGHDLTSFGHYPMCYLLMHHNMWTTVVRTKAGDVNRDTEVALKNLLESYPPSADPDWEKHWFADQEIITSALQPFKDQIVSIHRTNDIHGLAFGRADRAAWDRTKNVIPLIDAHLPQPSIEPKEWAEIRWFMNTRNEVPLEWLDEYYKKFTSYPRTDP